MARAPALAGPLVTQRSHKGHEDVASLPAGQAPSHPLSLLPPRIPPPARLSVRSLALRAALLLPVAALGAPALGLGQGQGQGEQRLSQLNFEVKGDYDAILGPGFEVLGEKVTPADLKRAIVVGAPGRSLLESAKLQVFIDEELARMKEEGLDLSKYEVTQADVQKAID